MTKGVSKTSIAEISKNAGIAKGTFYLYFKDKYDMVIYIGNVENASNQTTNRLNWYTFWGQGNNVPWFAEEVPVIFISVANPYHLLDVPMIKTYINCYSNNDYVLEAVIAKIAGESRFKGVSPVDPFCGRIELSY